MTDLPRGYDVWRLSGPDDDRAECPHCRNTGERDCEECGNPPDDANDCPECTGTGIVLCLCSEIDDDYGDYSGD